jgi:ATP-dependent Clp protease ATP-binding subunit ClpC
MRPSSSVISRRPNAADGTHAPISRDARDNRDGRDPRDTRDSRDGSIPPAPPSVSSMRVGHPATDVGALRREAETLAKERTERVSTSHLLVALARRGGLAGELLAERRVTPELLTKALRVATDDEVSSEAAVSSPDAARPIDRLLLRARDFAGRSRRLPAGGALASDVDGSHVLLAICVERGSAAHKTLGQLGVDLARLRASLVQHVTGSVEPRRRPAEAAHEISAPHANTQANAHAHPSTHARLESPPARPRTSMPLRPLPTARSSADPRPTSAPREPAGARHAHSTPPPPSGEVATRAPGAANSASDDREALQIQSIADAFLRDEAPHVAPNAAPPSPSAPVGPALMRKQPRNLKRTPSRDAKPPAEPTPFDLDPRTSPVLCAIGTNLTAMAARGELDPVVGRDAEIDRALDVLAKRSANNPCLVGAPGVGKTAIAHGVARRIAARQGVQGLDDRVIVEVPIGELLAGTGVRGALAERLGSIRKEVAQAHGRVVVFLDEIHALLGGEAGEEAANELKTALARGELPCIGATTLTEYKRAIERDAALARRFTVVDVPELDPAAAKIVIEAASGVLASHHGVTFDAAAKDCAIAWTVRYLPGRALPDKALAALDLAGARARRNARTTVGREALAEVVAEMADVPVARLLERDGERFLNLEARLCARVVGHAEPISKIARALRRGAAGLRGQRPLFSALLLGPTGVGKTETAKAIAEVLFDDPTAMTRLDLSEYAEPHAVARLLGAPPGYVGHDDGGQLTEAVRRRPYQVVLFDEMEKAHRDVLEALLQVLDEGRMTDGRGRTIDFTNTVVVFTSNLGSEVSFEAPRAPRRVGFGVADGGASVPTESLRREEAVIAAARAALPPELYNRYDEVLVFAPLQRADVAQIAKLALDRLGHDLQKSRGLSLQVDPEVIEVLLDHGGFDPSMGGRPVRREVARLVEAPLAELLLKGDVNPGDVVWITVEGGSIVVDLVK